ncbi:bacteriohemerythrin [Anaeromyxobacter oryzae]|uniref:Hemerythrin n=1 Tax=Anaeromyxobacter oryzae TaxID=2918170 RepID=A0ABM7WXH9_9BACT|nr:bacteriohemerythrin [Anaeromyxobacter oryzae]BDG04222.1 hemerythrin [Anaeromyxobacter oryzae]
MTIEFDPVLLTGDPSIDAQHRELFARIGALLEASHERRSRDEVRRMLDFLGDYVVSHFGAEERVMEDAGYPGLEAHRGEHRRFVQEFGALREEYQVEGPGPLFVIRVQNRVTAWLREHIYRNDRALGAWLRNRPR